MMQQLSANVIQVMTDSNCQCYPCTWGLVNKSLSEKDKRISLWQWKNVRDSLWNSLKPGWTTNWFQPIHSRHLYNQTWVPSNTFECFNNGTKELIAIHWCSVHKKNWKCNTLKLNQLLLDYLWDVEENQNRLLTQLMQFGTLGFVTKQVFLLGGKVQLKTSPLELLFYQTYQLKLLIPSGVVRN